MALIVPWLLCILWFTIYASARREPQETMLISSKTRSWTSKSTGSTIGEINVELLFARAAVGANTCGWQGPNSVSATQAVICPTGSCSWYSDIAAVACCPSSGCVSGEGLKYTSCVTSSHATSNSLLLTCTNTAAPNCYRNSYPDGYSQWGCHPYTSTGTAVLTYNGNSVTPAYATVSTSLSTSLSSTSTTASPVSTTTTVTPISTLVPSSTTRTSTRTSTTSTPATASVTTSSASESTGLSIEAKVGIGIGVLGTVLALIGIVLCCINRRYRAAYKASYSGRHTDYGHKPTWPPALPITNTVIEEKHAPPSTIAEMEAPFKSPASAYGGTGETVLTSERAVSVGDPRGLDVRGVSGHNASGNAAAYAWANWTNNTPRLNGFGPRAYELSGEGAVRYEMDARGKGIVP